MKALAFFRKGYFCVIENNSIKSCFEKELKFRDALKLKLQIVKIINEMCEKFLPELIITDEKKFIPESYKDIPFLKVETPDSAEHAYKLSLARLKQQYEIVKGYYIFKEKKKNSFLIVYVISNAEILDVQFKNYINDISKAVKTIVIKPVRVGLATYGSVIDISEEKEELFETDLLKHLLEINYKYSPDIIHLISDYSPSVVGCSKYFKIPLCITPSKNIIYQIGDSFVLKKDQKINIKVSEPEITVVRYKDKLCIKMNRSVRWQDVVDLYFMTSYLKKGGEICGKI